MNFLQDEMVRRKTLPHAEDEPEISDVQIIQEVLKDKNSSNTSTFLSKLGVSACPRKNAVSTARIRELEQRLADQEQQSVLAAERYKDMMENRMLAQDVILDDLRKEHDEKIAAIIKDQDEKALAYEKRQQEMDAVLNLLLRTSQHSSQSN